jgi:hypothetical protein
MADIQIPKSLNNLQVTIPALQGDVRRRTARVCVPIPVRLRPVDFSDGSFDDVASTVNISRGAMYVTTWRGNYYSGMRLIVTYPFLSETKSAVWEYLGEVLRVDRQGDGRSRVVIRLQFVMQPADSPSFITL